MLLCHVFSSRSHRRSPSACPPSRRLHRRSRLFRRFLPAYLRRRLLLSLPLLTSPTQGTRIAWPPLPSCLTTRKRAQDIGSPGMPTGPESGPSGTGRTPNLRSGTREVSSLPEAFFLLRYPLVWLERLPSFFFFFFLSCETVVDELWNHSSFFVFDEL